MRLESVTGHAFSVACIKCGKHGVAGSESYRNFRNTTENPETWFADLDGIPFVAYYCEACIQLMCKESAQ